MKVNNVPGIIGAYQKTGPRKAAKEQETSNAAKSDGVVLSKEAQAVRALKDKVSQAPEVRQERIDALRQQIEAGTYRPDGREVAAKMVKARVFDDLA